MQGEGFDYSTAYKTVNCYRFTRDFIAKYLESVHWYIDNVGEQCYYEKVLGSLIYLRDFDIRTVIVSEEMWCEIDDMSDLQRAGRFFREGDEER